jgi:hypothetical protein
MSSPDAIRIGVSASTSTMIPRMKATTAPIPARIAQAVPSGSSLRASDNSQKRAIIATMAMATRRAWKSPRRL